MKPNYFKPAAVMVTSLFMLMSCKKDASLLDRSSNQAVQTTLENETDATLINNTAQTAPNTLVIAQLKTVDLKVSDGKIEDGKIKFIVTNLGTTTSPICKAQVSYRCNSSFKYVYVTIPSIAGVGSVVTRLHLSVPVEAVCFNSDIQFTIIADYYKTVKETNETNNTFTGTQIN